MAAEASTFPFSPMLKWATLKHKKPYLQNGSEADFLTIDIFYLREHCGGVSKIQFTTVYVLLSFKVVHKLGRGYLIDVPLGR